MRSRNIGYALLLLGLWAPGVRADDAGLIAQIREWFEWGEYQKMVSVVTPLMADSAAHPALVGRPEVRLSLGVAHFSLGQLGQAREQFLTALSLDTAVTLDERYVTSEMVAFFLTIREDFLAQQHQQARSDSLLALQQAELARRQHALQLAQQERAAARGRRLAVSAAATGLLSAGLVGFSADQYYATKATYRQFRIEAGRGNLVEYNRLKSETVRGDVLTSVYTVMAVGSATASSLLIARLLKHRKLSKSQK